jgi:diguanylate cyclase (GGDEF)-like protein
VTQSAMLVSDSTAEMPWWLRAHRALMPDYNAKAASFWWLIVLLGSATLAHALMQVAAMPLEQRVQVFIGIGFATMSGLFPVMIPRMKNSFAAGEIFIFLLLLLHGPAAAAVAAACETAVGSYRSSKRWTSRIFSPANSALAIAAAGQALQAMRETLGHAGLASDGMLLLAAMGMAVLYFAMNIIGVVTVPLLKNNGRFAWRDLVGNFGWVGVAYGASASVATLLYLTFMQSGTGVLMAALPIIALLMATLHFYFRQSEADEVVRKSRVEAAEREAEQAARHVRELRHMAFHDSLTGLPNRTRFNDELAQAIDRVRAEPSYQFAVMFLDFDRFKLINDSLGHAVGDEFLVQVSRRIREHVRPQDVVARLGGDEFAVLLGGIDGEAAATSLAERLLAVLRQPLRVAGTELATSASIGITFSSFGYTSPGDVLRDADIAMYRAKAAGKARYAVVDVGLHNEASSRLRLESDLRHAVASGQLTVAYQPQYNLANGRLIGFEALARWKHPTLGAIEPMTFIALAEEAGIIMQVTDFVLQSACRQLKSWQATVPGCANLRMQVNISGNDLSHDALAQRVTRVIAETGLMPRHLTLELTENILMERLEGAMSTLADLRRLGVGLSIDDFGTGYSSLSYLSTLPIDSLKIDASFVRSMRAGSKETEVVRAIVGLGSSLGKAVVAEGIETPSQFAELRDMGCDAGQGFHLSHPLSAQEVEDLLGADFASVARAGVHAALPPAAVLHH